MKIILFGATGMIGQGVLRECLADPDVESVLAVTRSPLPETHAKLTELIHENFHDFSAVESALSGYDACLFCLGVSSAGMKEDAYTRVTYDLTLAAAEALVKHGATMTFIYISGAGTDGTEHGGSMWARVKGKTENALLRLPFRRVHMFRPGFIQPRNGIKSKTTLYRMLYAVLSPLYFMLRHLPGFVTSTDRLGRAMLEVAKHGAAKPILESRDINEIAARIGS